MENLLESAMEYQNNRCSFDLYKSNVCHQLKELGDIHFIVSVLESNDIRNYYKKKWYPEAFYQMCIRDSNHTMQKVDDSTLYATRKKVEDQCRASISSYESDKLTWNQYKDSDSELERSWANQAKMRANKTASVYNNYILKNKYVFEGNIPADRCV